MTAEQENNLVKLIEEMRVRGKETALKVNVLFDVLFAERPVVKKAMLKALKENPGDEPHIAERVRAWLKG